MSGLRLGDKGAPVKAFQLGLLAAGMILPRWGTDGSYGPETDTASATFARREGLAKARGESSAEIVARALAYTVPASDWLVPAEDRELSPHRYKSTHPRVKPLDLVVLHYTASPWQVPEKEEARVRRWGRGETRKSSTHFVILRTGKVLQLMPLSDRAWHVVDKYEHEGQPINYRSVGIDFGNVGFLTAQPDGTYRDYYGGRYLGPPPFIDENGRPWEPITAVQVDAARALLRTLGGLFPALREPGRLIGHSDVQPTRSDPGPACPRWLLENALMGDA